MLVRKTTTPTAPDSKDIENAKHELFSRLKNRARDEAFVLDCTVQMVDHEFVAVLSDPVTGSEICAWSGSADAITAEFAAWLERRSREPVHAAPRIH